MDADADADAAILAAMQRGNEEAAGRLMIRHFGEKLLAQARLLVGNADAPDLVQETLLAVLLRLRKEKPVAAVRSYAIQTLRNQAFNLHKSSWSKIWGASSDPQDHEPAPPSSKLRWNTLEADKVVEKLIARLPPQERVLVAYRLDGLDYAEVAQQLGKPEDTVRRSTNRAVEKLGRWFAEKYGGPSAAPPGTGG